MKYVYHYTNKDQKLPMILASGELLGRADFKREHPLLWFSSHPFWEPTATKCIIRGGLMVSLTFAEYRDIVGCVRFAFPADDARLMDWRKACKFAGIPKHDRWSMKVAGIKRGGNPQHWFALPEPLPLHQVRLEVLNGEKWEKA